MLAGTGELLDELTPIVRAETFYAESHRRIFEACEDLHRGGKPCDTVMVGTELRRTQRLEQVGGMAYLTEVLNVVPAMGNAVHYAHVVRDKWRVRQVIARAHLIVAQGYGDPGDVQEYIDSAEHELHELSRVSNPAKLEAFGDVARRAHNALRADAKSGRELAGRQTGFAALDRRLLGLRDGRLIVIAARPGVGKTALAMNIAHFVATHPEQGEATSEVAFFTLEMNNDELGTRALSAMSGVDQMSLGQPRRMSFDEWDAFSQAAKSAANVNIHLGDDPNMTVGTIRALCRRLQSEARRRGGKLALVVVDYLQLMEGAKGIRGQSREQEVSQISRSLKKLAKELCCTVIALSQLSRAGEDRGGETRRPKLSDLRESGAIEQDSDVVILIHPVAQSKSPGPPSLQRASGPTLHEFIVAKARGGRRGTVLATFDGSLTKFAETTRDERDEAAQ